MKIKNHEINVLPLTRESFLPFGEVLLPSDNKIDNIDLLSSGYAKMSNEVPSDRLNDFDVLNYWGDIANISQEPMRLGYLRPKKRPLIVSWFERHVKGTQSFIPLGGKPSIFVVAKGNENNNKDALPDLSLAKAFYLDGSSGLNIKPGTWHWTPFPIEDECDFIIIVRTDVKDDDLNFIDLEKKINSRIILKNF